MPHIIIKNKKRVNFPIDRCGNFRRQKCHAKAADKKLKYKRLYIETQRMLFLEKYQEEKAR
jgi:hypothetical protein